MRTEQEEIVFRVPGSIANLGPGFDTLAVAVELYLTLRVRRASAGGLQFAFVDTELVGENYIERAFRYMAEKRGVAIPSLAIQVESAIPMKSGLGSSAAATVAGLRLFEAVVEPISEDEMLQAACELEGHPDNIAAAIVGGLTVSCKTASGLRVLRAIWPQHLSILVATPQQFLSTQASRSVLPEKLPLADAIFNVQRVALLLEALRTEDFSLLHEALQDRLHQPYRAPLVPGLREALALRHPSLLGVCLSGAGPSVMAVVERDADEIATLLQQIYIRQSIPVIVRQLKVYPTQPKPQPVLV